MAEKKKVGYSEPDDFIPEDIQKEFKIGKYYDGESVFSQGGKAEKKKTISNKEFKDYLKKK